MLKATPHAVIQKSKTNGVSRNTFAMFTNPNFEEKMNPTEGYDIKRIYGNYPKEVPPL